MCSVVPSSLYPPIVLLSRRITLFLLDFPSLSIPMCCLSMFSSVSNSVRSGYPSSPPLLPFPIEVGTDWSRLVGRKREHSACLTRTKYFLKSERSGRRQDDRPPLAKRPPNESPPFRLSSPPHCICILISWARSRLASEYYFPFSFPIERWLFSHSPLFSYYASSSLRSCKHYDDQTHTQ